MIDEKQENILDGLFNNLQEDQDSFAIVIDADGCFSTDSKLSACNAINIVLMLIQEYDIPVNMIESLRKEEKIEQFYTEKDFEEHAKTTFKDELSKIAQPKSLTTKMFLGELSNEMKIALFDVMPIVNRLLDALREKQKFSLSEKEIDTLNIIFQDFIGSPEKLLQLSEKVTTFMTEVDTLDSENLKDFPDIIEEDN